MKARRLALEGAIMIVTIAMRLSPLERDLLAASLFVLHHQFWIRDDRKNGVRVSRQGAADSKNSQTPAPMKLG